MNYKLGKLPFEKDERDLKLSTYIDKTVLPDPPVSTDDYKAVNEWKMLKNDSLGCCAVAGPYHMLMGWNAEGKKAFDITDEVVQQTYSDISGYDPNDPSTDKGCVLRDVLKYWKNTGFADAEGNRHKIGAFAQLDQEDHKEVKVAQYIFSYLNIGFMVPAYAMEQFQNGQPWTVQTENDDIEGGHCVIPGGYGKYEGTVAGYNEDGVYVITWGAVQFMDWGFWDKYVDEVWVVFDTDFLINGESPDGFDVAQLQADLRALGDEESVVEKLEDKASEILSDISDF